MLLVIKAAVVVDVLVLCGWLVAHRPHLERLRLLGIATAATEGGRLVCTPGEAPLWLRE